MKKQSKDLIIKLKGDIIAVSVMLAAALLLFLLPQFVKGKQGNCEVIIMQDGAEICRYALSENRTVTVRGMDQSYNLILINEGSVRVTDADCPDKLCVRQKSISRNGESIICLPHKMIILIESPEESDLDAVTN